jgi:putative oxidoreductase
MNPAALYHKLDNFLGTIAGWLRSPFLLIIRFYWGWAFCRDGWGKFHHLDQVTRYFGGDLHLPLPRLNAILASSVECAGGLLLLLGLGGRLVPLPLIATMVVAYLTAEQEALHAVFTDPDKFLGADPFLFLYAAVIIFIFGPGKLSLDALFGRKTASGG